MSDRPAARSPGAPAAGPRALDPWVETFVRLMDDALRVPGTNVRFGLDAILGLLPGAGDVVTALASLAVLAVAARDGASPLVIVRMALNLGIDALVGTVPLLGTIFDVGFKANRRNLRLLERHRAGAVRPRDTWPVWALMVLAVASLVLPLVASLALGVWVLTALF